MKRLYNPVVHFYLNITPHYRKEILLKLVGQSKVEVKIFAGSNGLESIKKLDKSDFDDEKMKSFIDLTNYFLGPYLIWQSGVVSSMFRKGLTSAIFTGEITVLSTWIGILICRLRGIEAGIWGHGLYGNEGFILKNIRLLFHGLCHHNFVYGNHAKNLLKESGIDESTIEVIYNSLDLDDAKLKYEQLLTMKEFPSIKERKLLFVGRITPIKKLDLLIEALKILYEKDSRYHLEIIGDGEERDKIEALIQRHELKDKVHWYGAIYDINKLPKLIYNADLLVSPGNVGLNAIQSLMYGTPVCTHNDICYQMPEFEAIGERSGVTFTKDDFQHLAVKIELWFEGIKDKSRMEIRNNCRQVILDYYNADYQMTLFEKRLFTKKNFKGEI